MARNREMIIMVVCTATALPRSTARTTYDAADYRLFPTHYGMQYMY